MSISYLEYFRIAMKKACENNDGLPLTLEVFASQNPDPFQSRCTLCLTIGTYGFPVEYDVFFTDLQKIFEEIIHNDHIATLKVQFCNEISPYTHSLVLLVESLPKLSQVHLIYRNSRTSENCPIPREFLHAIMQRPQITNLVIETLPFQHNIQVVTEVLESCGRPLEVCVENKDRQTYGNVDVVSSIERLNPFVHVATKTWNGLVCYTVPLEEWKCQLGARGIKSARSHIVHGVSCVD